jgi:hypothetical protein
METVTVSVRINGSSHIFKKDEKNGWQVFCRGEFIIIDPRPGKSKEYDMTKLERAELAAYFYAVGKFSLSNALWGDYCRYVLFTDYRSMAEGTAIGFDTMKSYNKFFKQEVGNWRIGVARMTFCTQRDSKPADIYHYEQSLESFLSDRSVRPKSSAMDFSEKIVKSFRHEKGWELNYKFPGTKDRLSLSIDTGTYRNTQNGANESVEVEHLSVRYLEYTESYADMGYPKAYNSHQSQFFRITDLTEAIKCFNARANSDHPYRAHEEIPGISIDDLIADKTGS